MKIELRKDFTWSLVVPTSMGIRITPVNSQTVHTSNTFYMQATSAESNVVSVSSALGLPVKILTAFVKGSPIARFIKDNLASRHIAWEAKEVAQGDPRRAARKSSPGGGFRPSGQFDANPAWGAVPRMEGANLPERVGGLRCSGKTSPYAAASF